MKWDDSTTSAVRGIMVSFDIFNRDNIENVNQNIEKMVGFVPSDVFRLKKGVWFGRLNNEQVILVERQSPKLQVLWDKFKVKTNIYNH